MIFMVTHVYLCYYPGIEGVNNGIEVPKMLFNTIHPDY